jgi:hypothetical protein
VWTLAALLLWGLLIGVFYRLNGGDLAGGMKSGSAAAGAIGCLVMFWYRPLLAMGAPSLAGAIMRGSHEAHTLRGPDEHR